MNRDGINKTKFWSLLYIFLYSACTVIANLYLPNLLLITVGVGGIIYIIFNLFFIPYKREKLFVNGIFAAFMVFAGTILQSIAVKLLSKRDGFKGFPGTVFPFLCAVLAYFVLYYQVL